jgi:P4 family phage/plasmid primase-like protien
LPRDNTSNNDDAADAQDTDVDVWPDGTVSEDDGDTDGSQPAEELPSDLGGDEDDLGVEVDLADPVAVDDISTPRPVTRTIAARTLEYGAHPSDVWYNYLPSNPDECECISDDADADDEDAPDPVCTCEYNDDGIPYRSSVAKRKRVADAVDELEPAANAADDDRAETTVYGVVVQEFKSEDQFGGLAELQVRIADETGVADVELHPEMDPLQDYDVGDEIVVTDVERTLHGTDDDDAESNAAFKVTSESALLHVAESDLDVGERLKEQTALTRTPEKFEQLENKTAACNWVADVIVDEWHIETPRGGDDVWVYIDNEDSEKYGTFAGNGEDRIKEIIDQYLPPESCNRRNKNEIVALVKDRTYVREDAFKGGAPDAEPRRWSVAVQNGVIDLRTGELYEHDPAWRCTSKLPVEYDPSQYELGDAWDRFLDDVCKDAADRETLLYMLGHALARHYPIEAIFALIGPGKNGKTVFNKAVSPLFGDVKGTTDIGMMTDSSYEFGAGSVKGLHLAIDDDATDVKAQDLSLLKKLSGGAEAQMHEKEEKVSGADYDNYASIVMLSNDPPVFGDKSDGAKRRVYPVIMPHKFTSDPSDDHKDAVSEDELLADLTSEEELQRLLVVAVQYAQEIHRDCEDELPVGRSESERWELYEQYSDSVMRFWQNLMTQETGARVPRSVVYEIYVQWAETNGIDPLPAGGRNGFWKLSDQCPAVSYKRDGVYTDGDRAVEHVMITQEALEHAPRWVQDEWEADVSEDESTLANRLDRVTPIADLDKGYCTTEGRVIGRETIETNDGATGVRVTIEDTTHAIDVYEWLTDPDADATLDGVDVGDRITLERATLTASKGEPRLKVKNVTEITVAEAGPLKNEDDRHVEDGEDAGESDGEDMPQTERVTTVKNVVGSMQNRTDLISAPVEDVLNACEDRGIDREKAEHEVEKLKEKGELYAPKSGRVAVTGSD